MSPIIYSPQGRLAEEGAERRLLLSDALGLVIATGDWYSRVGVVAVETVVPWGSALKSGYEVSVAGIDAGSWLGRIAGAGGTFRGESSASP